MARQTGRILLVDDDPQVLRAYARALTAAGHEVVVSGEARQALKLLDAEPFDVVLTDISMPGMSGVELLRAVRALDLDIPVVLMTAAPSVATAARAVEYGAMRYILKPMDLTTLEAAMQDAIRLRRLAKLKHEAMAHMGTVTGAGDLAGLEASFERAVVGLRMVFQPIISSSRQVIHAHEALVRTSEPTFPHPGALLAAAERLGRLPDLGRAIRSLVAAVMSTKEGQGIFFVNLHPRDLLDADLYAATASLTPHAARVVLEITERAALEGVADVRDRLAALRRAGFRMALDDLGAGYSGLSSFATLEPDVVKLDMSLVRDLDHEPIKRRLVASITQLCQDTGIAVVAEGVETASERDALLALGCDLLQGYLYARPQVFPAIVKW